MKQLDFKNIRNEQKTFVHRGVTSLLLTAMVALATTGCGGLGSRLRGETNDESSAPSIATGCLQGIVVNGITGERVDLTPKTNKADTAESVDAGIRVLARSQVLSGSRSIDTVKADAVDKESLTGEYVLCGVPLDADFPMTVKIPGFQVFETIINVPSTAAAQTGQAETDIVLSKPTRTANVRLFPMATGAKNYTVTVHTSGKGVSGAQVMLRPIGTASVVQGHSDDFLAPFNPRAATLAAVTDKNGRADFVSSSLMLGGQYRLAVLPPDGLPAAASVNTDVTIGLVAITGDDPYQAFIDLDQIAEDLVVQSSSLDTNDYAPDGVVTYFFSRAIELVPGTEEYADAQLSKAVVAKLADNNLATPGNEKVQLIVKGNQLTIKPVLRVKPDSKIEPGLTISYSGIAVRPLSGVGLDQRLSLAPTLSFFGGRASPAVATMLMLNSGDGQLGSAGRSLSQALSVAVKDQYGQPISGVPVSFAVASGGGSLSAINTTSDSSGLAAVTWVLGTVGAQRVEAQITNGRKVEFSASLLAATQMVLVSGGNQSALINEVLASPVTARFLDVNGVPVVGTPVSVSVEDTVNGGVLAASNGGAGNTVLNLVSSAAGTVSFYWTMGSVAGNYNVRLDSGTLTPIRVAARAMPLAATQVVKVSGDAQVGTAGQALAAPVVVRVLDQRQRPLAGVTVQLTTTATGGSIAADGVAGPSINAITDAEGMVTAVWTLGTPGGGTAQSMTARVTGLTVLSFSATAN